MAPLDAKRNWRLQLLRKLPGVGFRIASARHDFAAGISREGAKAQSFRGGQVVLVPWRLSAFA